MSQKTVLGRGFSSLLPTAQSKATQSPAQPPAGQLQIAIDKIVRNENQPRRHFAAESIQELSRSIRENGVLQPLLVEPKGQGYQLIAGERRLRAATLAGLKNVPVVVRNPTDQQRVEIALIENIQREDLNPIEEATAYSNLLNDFGLTQEEVGQRLGKSRSAVANTLRLLKLPQKVQQHLMRGELTAGQVRPLLSLKSESQILEMVEGILAGGMSARSVERATTNKPKVTKKSIGSKSNPFLRDIESRLRNKLGTKVEVREDKGRGQIGLHFYSLEDLGRILEVIEAD
jgi:ParB family chromosome partitioning protein